MGARGAKAQDLTGRRFGKLTVLEMIPGTISRSPSVLCQCDCGNRIIVLTGNLKRGNTRSCGCLRKEIRAKQVAERHDNPRTERTPVKRIEPERFVGCRFGRLVVTGIAPRNKHGQAMVKCDCDCGSETTVRLSLLKNGNTTSCGCGRAIDARRRHTTHGDAGKDSANHRLYSIWKTMHFRCENPNASYYHEYGGRGIKVCDDWRQWETFRDWALSHGYTDELTIDRISNDKGYSPDNCRWASVLKQANNRRKNLYIQYHGDIRTCSEWSRILGMPYAELYSKVCALLENAAMSEENNHEAKLPPMTGDYGYLTVIGKASVDSRGNRKVKCRCICGKVKEYRLSNLKSGRIRSCGCMRRVLIAAAKSKHHDSVPESDFHQLYGIWKAMRNRRIRSDYSEGSLIGVDESWDDWETFKAWSLDHGYRLGKHMVRVDNSKPYGPSNCLWVVSGEHVFREADVIVDHYA